MREASKKKHPGNQGDATHDRFVRNRRILSVGCGTFLCFIVCVLLRCPSRGRGVYVGEVLFVVVRKIRRVRRYIFCVVLCGVCVLLWKEQIG
jgi:hypothetical protein